MKKSLLSFLAVTATMTAVAMTPSLQFNGQNGHRQMRNSSFRHALKNEAVMQGGKSHVLRAPSADEELTMNWGYCAGAYSAAPTNYGEFKAAIQLTPELATEFAGAVLSSVSLASPPDASTYHPDANGYPAYDCPIKTAKVWLAYDLKEEPFVTGEGSLDPVAFNWNEIKLDKPYTIEAGKAIYIGYTLDVPEIEDMYAFVIDGDWPESNVTCYTYSTFTGWDEDYWPVFGTEYKWRQQGYDYGNASILARISGNMLPVNQMVIEDYFVDPSPVPGEPFEAGLYVTNKGANSLESMTLTMEIEGMQPQVADIKLTYGPLAYNESSIDYPEFVCTTVGNNIPYKLYISALNGEAVDMKDEAIEGYLLCIDKGYPRNVVIEEGTGTWCGWCVLGYAGMEYMAKYYGEKGFIGIAIHSGDEMEVMDEGDAYAFLSDVITGFPTGYCNRDLKNSLYPEPQELEGVFLQKKVIPAFAQISATIEKGADERHLTLNTKTSFAMGEEDADYSVAYTVIEDQVGPYIQANYCSDAPGEYYGFGDLPEKVALLYNEVARNCSKPEGIEGSLPGVTEQDKEYGYSTPIELPEADVIDPLKVRVVAMVINNKTGMIENACEVEVPGYTDVKTISESKALSAVYGGKGMIGFRTNADGASVYTLDGRCVARNVKGNGVAVPAGLYVVVLDGKAVKVAVR